MKKKKFTLKLLSSLITILLIVSLSQSIAIFATEDNNSTKTTIEKEDSNETNIESDENNANDDDIKIENNTQKKPNNNTQNNKDTEVQNIPDDKTEEYTTEDNSNYTDKEETRNKGTLSSIDYDKTETFKTSDKTPISINALNSSQKESFITLVGDCLKNTQSNLDVKEFKIQVNDLSSLIEDAFNSNLLVFNSYSYINCYYYYDNDNNVLELEFNYAETKEEFTKRYNNLSKETSKILSTVDTSFNDLQKALYIHDYLAINAKYDYDNYNNNSVPDISHTAYGIIINKVGVCDGYANAYKLLLSQLGIDSRIVISYSLSHAWNLIKIDGTWYHVDITWDDPAPDIKGYSGHKYFMRNDNEFKDLNHYTWENTGVKSISTKYSNWYIHEIINSLIYKENYYYYTTGNGIFKNNIQGTNKSIIVTTPTNTLSEYNNRLYFDKEMKIYSCKLDGSDIQLVHNASSDINSSYKPIIGYMTISTDANLTYTILYQIDNNPLAMKENTISLSQSIPLQSVYITESNIKMAVNEKHTLKYGFVPSNTTDSKSVTWTSSNNSIVTISSTGVLTAKKAGTATITIKCGNKTAIANVTVTKEIPSISYTTHVQSYGWLNWVGNGKMSGTTGESKRMEAIKIKVNNNSNLGIQYSTHVQNYGWLNWVKNGALSGTSGESKRMEAIKIELIGADASNYDIYYRVHAENLGWLGWSKNGEPAGTEGFAKRLEAIEIVVVAKGALSPGSGLNSFIENTPNVLYTTHVQNYGWLDAVANGAISGTTGESKRLESIAIKLENGNTSGGITYRTHVESYGWLNWSSNGSPNGTTGKGKRLEAIEIKLTGDIASKYDVYYRVHAQSYGWMGWSKNGEAAGTSGQSKRLEAIQIVLVKKGEPAPGSTANHYIGK